MSLIETSETNLYTFEPFAAHTFYTDVNRALVKHTLKHLIQRRVRLHSGVVALCLLSTARVAARDGAQPEARLKSEQIRVEAASCVTIAQHANADRFAHVQSPVAGGLTRHLCDHP